MCDTSGKEWGFCPWCGEEKVLGFKDPDPPTRHNGYVICDRCAVSQGYINPADIIEVREVHEAQEWQQQSLL